MSPAQAGACQKRRWDRRYTYLYDDNNSQVLDYILISPEFFDFFTAVGVLRFNASYPAALSDVPTTPIRSSDHDPVEGRFWFGQHHGRMRKPNAPGG